MSEPEGPESALRGARPSEARARRIVSGALERSEPRGFRWVAAVAIVASMVVAMVVARLLLRPAPPLGELASGAAVRASEFAGHYRARGHGITLEVDSELQAEQVTDAATALWVVRGAASFKVRHLTAGERFWVSAGAVTVEAVGTQFEVALQGPCARVEVTEGRVEVRRPGRDAERIGAGSPHVYCERPESPEALTEEEQLVFSALADVRRGTGADLARAAEQFKVYEQRYPRGTYDEEALYYLARIARKLGHHDESAQWARQLLERFPNSRRAAELR